MIFKIAVKNVFAAGLRTWLNVFVLSLTLGAMVFMQGLMDGMLDEMRTARIYEEISGGQLWHEAYDPFDPLTIDRSRSEMPAKLAEATQKGEACPLLLLNGAVYPKGRFVSARFNGIDPQQTCLKLDFSPLSRELPNDMLPVMIGKRWAKSLHLVKGDIVTLRWRTEQGAFNALDAVVVELLDSQVPVMDTNQVWLSFNTLNHMNDTRDYASLYWIKDGSHPPAIDGWKFQTQDMLLQDTIDLVETKQAGQRIFYALLLILGLVAVFDTQALAIFRRKKEIGTLMALGMSNAKVLKLFVVEGAMYSILATLVTAIWGGPLFYWTVQHGVDFGISGEQMGLAISSIFYPVFRPARVLGSILFINLLVILVSYWPARRITRVLPADALRGRLS